MNAGSRKIAIVGAGLLGRLLAWRLLLRRQKVTLFEATSFDAPQSAAHTAAAMISPFSEVVVSERLIFDLGRASLALWPEWLAHLNASAAGKVHYSAAGSIVLAHAQDQAELSQFRQDLHYILGADDESRWLTPEELAQREPQLAHFGEALYLPGEAYLDNRHLLDRLLEEITALGADCRERTPVQIEGDSLVHGGGRENGFDLIIDCRGMGSKQSDDRLRGVRGEVMWIHSPEFHLQHALRLMHPRYKLYVVPKPGQRFIIGATEIESEDRSAISLQSTLELASALYTINPVLAEARVIETDSNLRPALPDNMPHIRVAERNISINGLYRHGYLLAPVMVNHLVDFVCEQRRGAFWSALAE